MEGFQARFAVTRSTHGRGGGGGIKVLCERDTVAHPLTLT